MIKISNLRTSGIIAIIASLGITSQVFAYTIIGQTLDLGESNADVTNLQTYFKDSPAIYPEGLVTGYYGNLTARAVQRFQVQNGIVSSGSAATTGYGRVGPSTRDRINAQINQGGVVSTNGTSPWISSVNSTMTSNSATFTWNTDKNTTAKVFYNTSPITLNEGDENSVGFGATNGFTATNDGLTRTSQQVTISNLMPNTQYYYVLVSTDAAGNVSVYGPNNTFRTNQ